MGRLDAFLKEWAEPLEGDSRLHPRRTQWWWGGHHSGWGAPRQQIPNRVIDKKDWKRGKNGACAF